MVKLELWITVSDLFGSSLRRGVARSKFGLPHIPKSSLLSSNQPRALQLLTRRFALMLTDKEVIGGTTRLVIGFKTG